MADDRHEAYRAMFSIQEIGEEIKLLTKDEVASLLYNCTRQALNTSIYETSPINLFRELLKHYKK
jgi:hypothetical protein